MSIKRNDTNIVESLLKELGGLTIKVVGPHNFQKYDGRRGGAEIFISQLKPYWMQWTESELWSHVEYNLEGKAKNWFVGAKGLLFTTREEFEREFLEMLGAEQVSKTTQLLIKLKECKFRIGNLEDEISELFACRIESICIEEISKVIALNMPRDLQEKFF